MAATRNPKASTVLLITATLTAVAAAAALSFMDLSSGALTTVHGNQLGEPTVLDSPSPQRGARASRGLALLAPAAGCLLPLCFSGQSARCVSTVTVAGLLTVLVILGLPSIGLYFMPSAVFMWFSAIARGR